jgi:hypothetical protein
MFANLRPRIVDLDGEMPAWSISHSVPFGVRTRVPWAACNSRRCAGSVYNASAISRCAALVNIVLDRSGPSGWRNGTPVSLLLVRDCLLWSLNRSRQSNSGRSRRVLQPHRRTPLSIIAQWTWRLLQENRRRIADRYSVCSGFATLTRPPRTVKLLAFS